MSTEIATTMTPESVYALLQELKQFNATAGEAFLKFGKRWAILREGKAHKVLGLARFDELISHYTNFSRSYVYLTMGIWDKFGKGIEGGNVQLLDIEITRFRDALPFVKTEGDAIKWLEQAQALPCIGWKDTIREARGQTPSDGECSHVITETHTRCTNCNKWLS